MREAQAALPLHAIDVLIRATWRSSRTPWLLLIAGTAGGLLVAGVSLNMLRLEQVQRGTLMASLTKLRAQIQANQTKAGANLAATGSTPPTDFVTKLPLAPDVRPLLFELERATARAGVAFDSVQLQERPATPEQLSRTEATVTLRGNYPSLKSAMLDVLGRFPNATLVQWRLRRVTQPSDLETTMVVALWGAASESRVPVSAPTLASGSR